MVAYQNYLVVFGGIQETTKEFNDIYLYSADDNRWSKIHSNTNSVYDSSPTLKKSFKNSPVRPV